jgi:hypothetical protein
MPAKFQPGDVVLIAGQEWTIATWPANNRGMFTYYRDVQGTRTWGVAAASTSNVVLNSEGEVVSTQGEPVTEPLTPVFVRSGEVTDNQDLREIADE